MAKYTTRRITSYENGKIVDDYIVLREESSFGDHMSIKVENLTHVIEVLNNAVKEEAPKNI